MIYVACTGLIESGASGVAARGKREFGQVNLKSGSISVIAVVLCCLDGSRSLPFLNLNHSALFRRVSRLAGSFVGAISTRVVPLSTLQNVASPSSTHTLTHRLLHLHAPRRCKKAALHLSGQHLLLLPQNSLLLLFKTRLFILETSNSAAAC